MAELDFEKCIRDGDNQAMKECESYIGMTLAEAFNTVRVREASRLS